ncbi:MAG: hypothetical protein ACOC9Y_01865 [Chloroflexota bacterium]
MFEQSEFPTHTTLQDRDLLYRLTDYFDSVDSRLRHGEGWLIFNASGRRGSRIARFVVDRAKELRPARSFLFLPWREVAITSYLVEVELKSMQDADEALSDAEREGLQVATRVSRQTMARSVTTDLLILTDLAPQYDHEIEYLEETIERRYRDRLSTIILTPEQPHELASDIARNARTGEEAWQRLSQRLYETSLVAI